MKTTDVPPAFHSGQYATYCQNNLLCMGSDLLTMNYNGNTFNDLKNKILQKLPWVMTWIWGILAVFTTIKILHKKTICKDLLNLFLRLVQLIAERR